MVNKPGIQSKSFSFGNVIFMQNSWTTWSVVADSIPARWTLSDAWLPSSVRWARLPFTIHGICYRFWHNFCYLAFGALMLLVRQQERHPAYKKLSGGVLTADMVICLELGELVQACIWPSWCHCHWLVSCFSKIQTGFAFLVPVHPGSPRKRAVKRVCVCMLLLLLLLPITLMMLAVQSLECVRVQTIIYEQYDLWCRYLVHWFILMITTSSFKIKVMGRSSSLHEQTGSVSTTDTHYKVLAELSIMHITFLRNSNYWLVVRQVNFKKWLVWLWLKAYWLSFTVVTAAAFVSVKYYYKCVQKVK